jgi:hypothetical protein
MLLTFWQDSWLRSFWIHHWVPLLLTGHVWFFKLKQNKIFSAATGNLQLHSICIPLLFSLREMYEGGSIFYDCGTLGGRS